MIRKGTLWKRLQERTRSALSSGALLPIQTDYSFIEDQGIRFFMRIITGLERKDAFKKSEREKRKRAGEKVNPFLPFEEELFVSDISDSHVAVLNKFNVVDHHLLIITRAYEDQESLLTLRDFEALWTCLNEYDGLGFYNGGKTAGASQPHKHLQVVPLPLAPEGPSVPIAPLLHSVKTINDFLIHAHLPFLHSIVRIDSMDHEDIAVTAHRSLELYRSMLADVGLNPLTKEGVQWQSGPYCLLVTRDWMFLIPRSKEFFGTVSINSLGFAGALLVRNKEEMTFLRKEGPMKALQSVSFPWD